MNPAVDVLNRYINIWFVPTFVIVGIIGYTVCLTVLLRRPPFPKDIQGWFTAFSFAEIYVLIVSGTDYYFMSVFNISLREVNFLCCKLMPIFIYSGYFLVCWIQAGISVLRAYAMCNPLRSKIDITKRRSNIALLAVAIFGVCLYTTLVILMVEFKEGFEKDAPKNGSNISSANSSTSNEDEDGDAYCYTSSNFIIIDFVFKDGIPFVLLLISTVLICHSLRRSIVPINTRARSHRNRITSTLLLMNGTYFFSQPLFNTIVFDHHTKNLLQLSPRKFYLVLNILTLLTHVDFATNWLFFMMLGKHFRKHLKLSMCRLCLGCGNRCCGVGSADFLEETTGQGHLLMVKRYSHTNIPDDGKSSFAEIKTIPI